MIVKTNTSLFYVLTIIVFASCQKQDRTNEFKQKIQGEWFLIPEFERENFQTSRGYTFYPNGNVECKNGFYNKKKLGIYGEDTTQYMSRYEIIGDSINIFSLTDSVWERLKILKITDDTLIFQIKCETYPFEYCNNKKYAKYSKPLDTSFLFDRISLTLYGCYGECPIMKLNIHENGKMEFFGKAFTEKIGYYKAQIPIEKYNELANNFRKVNILTLKEGYELRCSDMEHLSVSFWKNNTLVKQIHDCDQSKPSAFVCAYNKLRDLYHKYELMPMSKKEGNKVFCDATPSVFQSKID